jgi:hypothetical protein
MRLRSATGPFARGFRRYEDRWSHMLEEAQAARLRALQRAEAAEERLSESERTLREMTPEQRVHLLISREWLESTTESERRKHPLSAYVLSPRLIADSGEALDLPRSALARACAAVASKCPPMLAGYISLPIIVEHPGPATESLRGATRWRCSIGRDDRYDAFLLYREGPDRTIEFAGLEFDRQRKDSPSSLVESDCR